MTESVFLVSRVIFAKIKNKLQGTEKKKGGVVVFKKLTKE